MEAKGLRSLRIRLASPEQILSWSYGEVTKPETINYRRLRPEKDGLFCEAIFGPQKDWQCYCGKYKNIRYKGIKCDKCGVEVTRASVRRERMGHIILAAPVAHVWYTRRVPSFMGILLDVSRRNLDRVLYFAQYVVTNVDEDARKKALDRLDKEVGIADQRLRAEIHAKMDVAKAFRDKRTAATKQRIEVVNERYDADLTKRIEPLLSEGKLLQQTVADERGNVARTAVRLKTAGVVIVPAGETYAVKHQTALKAALREHLNVVEGALKAKRDEKIAGLKMDLEAAKAEAALEINLQQGKLDELVDEQRKRVAADRDELQGMHQLMFLPEPKYRELKQKWGQVFKAGMGAEAFRDILSTLDLNKLSKELWHEMRTTKSKQKKKKATKRIKVVEALRSSGNKPEWMVLTVLPVIPPDLRPMVQLDGGRFATSDLNDLYRRVINRNNRLKRLLDLGAPDVIVRNEKRMLQEAVDSLVDNAQRGKALSRRGRRELKSLSDMLKGKKGRFRRNLLGKRVDYSGRSVIVVGPKLKLHQCGLPYVMAKELFRPFIIAKLVQYDFCSNVKGAKRLMDRDTPEVREVVDEVTKDRPVLLNRAPTLHRLGIQAFEPVVVPGKALLLHPLVCAAFNADFDGDQMAVHVPLSSKSVEEARRLMLSTKNLLKPADGEPIVGPSKDMVLGVYYLTMIVGGKKGEGRMFGNLEEVSLAYALDQVHLHAKIKLLVHNYYEKTDQRYADAQPRTEIIDTSVGRALFNRVLPDEMHFVNELLDKSSVQRVVARCYQVVGAERTTDVVDAIKNIGFKYATRSGVTIAVSDITVPPLKAKIVDDTEEEVVDLGRQYKRGLLTEQELTDRTVELWQAARVKVEQEVRKHLDPNGNLSVMALSGATKGGFTPITQLAGMRGLMADPSGRIIPLPIRSNFREGLRALEYFISTHGSRKGLADTALRTADAGYLTRRLCDIAQDVIINRIDCGTEDGTPVRRRNDVAGQKFSERIKGRWVASDVVHPKTGEVLASRNEEITDELAKVLDLSQVDEVLARSPLTCAASTGLCAMCYGRDLGRGALVEIGVAVGIIAAQSIGEPGTQLTLRTFHTGGVAAGGDITSGLPRVEELFEARKQPKGEAEIAEIEGTIELEKGDGYLRTVKIINNQTIVDEYEVPGNWSLKVSDGEDISEGQLLAARGDSQMLAINKGKARLTKDKLLVARQLYEEAIVELPPAARLLVTNGQKVSAGDRLTEGSFNPHRILRILGRNACELYLLSEIQKVYRSQGQNIHDKHFEVIIRKMMSKVQVVRAGDSGLVPGELMDRYAMQLRNEQLLAEGKAGATVVPMLLGITKGSLETNSWLSASSVQHTIKVLAGAAMEAKEDPLAGLKENVIIGKLIPAGSGFGSNLPKLPEAVEELDEIETPDPLLGELVLEGVDAAPPGIDDLPLAAV